MQGLLIGQEEMKDAYENGNLEVGEDGRHCARGVIAVV